MNTTKHLRHQFCILHSAFCIAAITSLTSAAFAADVSDVIVRQQWPWSTDIKVEFKLTNVTNGPVTVNVEAFDGATPLDSSNLKSAITGDLYGIDQGGIFSFMINPAKAFGNTRVAIPDFRIKLAVTDAPTANEAVYKIVNLTSPYTVTDVTRKDLMNGKWGKIATSFSEIDPSFSTSLDDVLIWLDVTNDVYKTSKMVFRRIPAAGKSFQFQKGITAATNAYYTAGQGIKVSFAKDYYIGVFEVTQRQFLYCSDTGLLSWNKFYWTNSEYREKRPAEQIDWQRQYADYPSLYRQSGGSSDKRGAIVARMQDVTKLNVKIPTEAMWEFACRAGTDTFKYSGESGSLGANDGFSVKVQRAGSVNGDGNWSAARTSDIGYGTMTVGAFKPNAFGLYDMLGNVREWCSDRYLGVGNYWKCACYAEEDNLDPTGPTAAEANNTGYHVLRGGSWSDNPLAEGSMARQQSTDNQDRRVGVRLCIFLTNNADGTL